MVLVHHQRHIAPFGLADIFFIKQGMRMNLREAQEGAGLTFHRGQPGDLVLEALQEDQQRSRKFSRQTVALTTTREGETRSDTTTQQEAAPLRPAGGGYLGYR